MTAVSGVLDIEILVISCALLEYLRLCNTKGHGNFLSLCLLSKPFHYPFFLLILLDNLHRHKMKINKRLQRALSLSLVFAARIKRHDPQLSPGLACGD
jgi:hypothetical protein